MPGLKFSKGDLKHPLPLACPPKNKNKNLF